MGSKVAEKEMNDLSKVSRSAVLLAVCSALFLMPFMVSAVAVSLPRIGWDLGASARQIGLVETLYVSSAAVFLLVMGRAGDIWGHRRIFVWGVVLFCVVTVLMALSLSIEMLIGLRFFQGMGAAMINAGSLAIVVSVFPPGERGRVLGICVASVYGGISCGPVIGGLLTTAWGWRTVFLPAAFLGLFSWLLAWTKIRGEWRASAGEPFDWKGSLIFALAILSLTFGTAHLDEGVWARGLAALGLVCLVLFVWLEIRTKHPLLDISLLRSNRMFVLSNIAALINYGATFGVVFYMGLYLQYVKGMTPRAAGLVMMVQPLVQMLLAPVGGRLADRYPAARVATAGMALCGAGLLLASTITTTTSVAAVTATLVLLGLGFAFFSSPNTSLIMGSLEKRHLGVASGMTGTMRTLGMTLSMVVVTLSFSVFMNSQGVTSETIPAFMRSMRIDLAVFGGLCLGGICCSLARFVAPRTSSAVGPCGNESPEDRPGRS
jgi:EmrB/QacA subfamily drug resistance transporter